MHPTLTPSETPRVLVVEDDPVSAKLIQRFLTLEGILVDHAPNGTVALEMHSKASYRLVVSDWMMPEMDGVTLCHEFRKLPGAYVYFILCSAKHQREDRIHAFEAGVDDFLTKPLDRHEMAARLKVARRILATEDALQKQNVQLEANALILAETNNRLEVASRRFQELFNGLPVACCTFDREGRIKEWNRAAHAVFGIGAKEVANRTIWDVLDQGDHPIWNPQRIAQFFGGESQPVFDWEYVHEGKTRYLAGSVICMQDEGMAVSAICANLDITDRKIAETKVEEYAKVLADQKKELEMINGRLSHLAITDGLTGLWNHRRFQELLEENADEYERTMEPFSLILLDIDHFKRINDEFGHQTGDLVLQQFADSLKAQSRSYELPARYGGEEFAIILRTCGVEESIAAAERFRMNLESLPWKHSPITASFGVTTCTMASSNPKTLIAQADKALYAAKQAGRNRTVHWSALPQPASASVSES